MPCSEKGNLTDEAFFFYRKKAGSFSHQKRDRTAWWVIYQVGSKDWRQLDDGSEQTVNDCLTTHWVTYTQSLSVFSGADLTHLYVVFEVVSAGASSLIVQVRNVRYSPA
jgi:hypothetical protein